MSTDISAEGQGTQVQQRTRCFLFGRADSICRIMHAEYSGVAERDMRCIAEHAHSGSTDLNRCFLHSLYAVGVLPPRTLPKGAVLARLVFSFRLDQIEHRVVISRTIPRSISGSFIPRTQRQWY
jgi:hypothetical protein